MAVATTAYYADHEQGPGSPMYRTRLGADAAALAAALHGFAKGFGADLEWQTAVGGPGPEFPDLKDEVIESLRAALLDYKISRADHLRASEAVHFGKVKCSRCNHWWDQRDGKTCEYCGPKLGIPLPRTQANLLATGSCGCELCEHRSR